MGDINATIGQVGGSAAKVGSLWSSTKAFTFGKFYGDTTPTIEVGFSGTLADGVGGDTT
jgi:hypothetical protein